MSHIEQGNGKIIFWVILVLAIVAAGIVVWPFVPAILWATVLTVLLNPMYQKLRKRTSDTGAALIVTLGPAALIIGALIAAGAVGGAQGLAKLNEALATPPKQEQSVKPTGQPTPESPAGLGAASESTKTASEPAETNLDRFAALIDDAIAPLAAYVGAKDFKVKPYWEEHQAEIIQGIRAPLINAVKGFVIGAVTLVISLLTMFFMMRDGHRLLDPACEVVPLPREETITILERMATTIKAVFIGIVLVAIIQGFMAGIAYWALGVPGAFLWMLITMIACMIPLLGSPIIYVPLSLWLISKGEPVKGAILLVVGFGIISNIDNLLRPFFIGASAKLHPMAVFFSLLGGVLAMGPVGLMAGPMLLTLLLGLTDVVRVRRRLIDQVSEAPA